MLILLAVFAYLCGRYILILTQISKTNMNATFMGTGTSLGVPIIGCDCATCTSDNPRDKRTRSSMHIETQGISIIIDTGPDFRTQCLANNVDRVDAVLITHPHRDHLAGLDDIRPFCYKQQGEIPVYASAMSCEAIRRDFAYCFQEPKYPGVPDISLREIKYMEPFQIGGISILPIPVMHGKMEIAAYRIGGFTYVTDANSISPQSMDAIRGTEYLVINSLSTRQHHSHFSLEEALEVVELIQPRTAWLTHVGHSLGRYNDTEPTLPKNVHLSYDGLRLELPL